MAIPFPTPVPVVLPKGHKPPPRVIPTRLEVKSQRGEKAVLVVYVGNPGVSEEWAFSAACTAAVVLGFPIVEAYYWTGDPEVLLIDRFAYAAPNSRNSFWGGEPDE